jgi:hypothetical protein
MVRFWKQHIDMQYPLRGANLLFNSRRALAESGLAA